VKKQIRDVKVIDLITYSILPPIFIVLIWVLFVGLIIGTGVIPPWVVYVVFGLVTYFLTRRTLIGIVLLYKVLAPQSVRNACRFYPTCSTYMIMSINKYGIIWGITKGVKRLLRCKPPYGGIDYP